MAKAAVQTEGRRGAKLTPAQLEARAQQRLEDDELIREAQKGDRGSFDALVRRYDASVLRLALHMLANEQDAQDVHQEAFLKAYRHLANFRFECSFYTWLYRIVTNLCLDQLRRRKSRREDAATATDSSGDEIDLMANVTDDRSMANPGRELDRRTMAEGIATALDKLTPPRAYRLRAQALPGFETPHHRRDVEHHGGDRKKHPLPRHPEAPAESRPAPLRLCTIDSRRPATDRCVLRQGSPGRRSGSAAPKTLRLM